MLFAICFNLDQSQILWSGNGLKQTAGRFLKVLKEKEKENAGNTHFLLFPHFFSILSKEIPSSLAHVNKCLQTLWIHAKFYY